MDESFGGVTPPTWRSHAYDPVLEAKRHNAQLLLRDSSLTFADHTATYDGAQRSGNQSLSPSGEAQRAVTPTEM